MKTRAHLRWLGLTFCLSLGGSGIARADDCGSLNAQIAAVQSSITNIGQENAEGNRGPGYDAQTRAKLVGMLNSLQRMRASCSNGSSQTSPATASPGASTQAVINQVGSLLSGYLAERAQERAQEEARQAELERAQEEQRQREKEAREAAIRLHDATVEQLAQSAEDAFRSSHGGARTFVASMELACDPEMQALRPGACEEAKRTAADAIQAQNNFTRGAAELAAMAAATPNRTTGPPGPSGVAPPFDPVSINPVATVPSAQPAASAVAPASPPAVVCQFFPDWPAKDWSIKEKKQLCNGLQVYRQKVLNRPPSCQAIFRFGAYRDPEAAHEWKTTLKIPLKVTGGSYTYRDYSVLEFNHGALDLSQIVIPYRNDTMDPAPEFGPSDAEVLPEIQVIEDECGGASTVDNEGRPCVAGRFYGKVITICR